MPPITDLRPGCIIFNEGALRGTLTCFAYELGVQGRLHGITARHVIPSGQRVYLGSPKTSSAVIIGGPAKHAPHMDALHFRIDDGIKQQLAEGNFIPVGYAAHVDAVWDPGKLRHKVDTASSATVEEQLKKKTMLVQHMGGTSTWLTLSFMDPFRAPVAGYIAKWGPADEDVTIEATQIAGGDSGGPVIDPAKSRYVGMVSAAATQNVSAEGNVLYLHDILTQFQMALATWANRAHWQ